MKNLIRTTFFGIFTLLGFSSFGQSVEMADKMRSEGKIYVVVAVILIILIGVILYLFVQDRKLSRLEESIKNKSQTK